MAATAPGKQFAEQGFLGVNSPVEYGGLGLGHLDALVVLEEFGRCRDLARRACVARAVSCPR